MCILWCFWNQLELIIWAHYSDRKGLATPMRIWCVFQKRIKQPKDCKVCAINDDFRINWKSSFLVSLTSLLKPQWSFNYFFSSPMRIRHGFIKRIKQPKIAKYAHFLWSLINWNSSFALILTSRYSNGTGLETRMRIWGVFQKRIKQPKIAKYAHFMKIFESIETSVFRLSPPDFADGNVLAAPKRIRYAFLKRINLAKTTKYLHFIKFFKLRCVPEKNRTRKVCAFQEDFIINSNSSFPVILTSLFRHKRSFKFFSSNSNEKSGLVSLKE